MSNMVVQTNVLSLNSHRNMKNVGSLQTKASQKLSSGYKINSAADDASGLAISEKMRAQIRGLDTASKNTQDAISLIQVAEGGMEEVDNMLQKIRDLTVKVSTDSNEHNKLGTGDRQKIQDEINAFTAEIDSMSERVEFNKKKVINGSFSDPSSNLESAATRLSEAQNKLTAGLAQRASAASQQDKANADYDVVKTAVGTFETALSTRTKAVETAVKGLKNVAIPAVTSTDTGLNTGKANAALEAFKKDLIDTAPSELNQSKLESLMSKHFSGNAITDGTLSKNITSITNDASLGNASTAVGAAAVVNDGTGSTAEFATALAAITAEVEKVFIAQKNLENIDSNNVAPTNINGGTGVAGHFSVAGNAKLSAANTASGNTSYAAAGSFTNSASLYKAAAEYTVTRSKADSDFNNANKNVESLQKQVANYTNQASLAIAASGTSKELHFQVGANATQSLQMSIGSVKTDVLGIGNGKGDSKINVLKDTGADITRHLNTLDEALSYVTTERSKLGAAQNRLEHTMKSLDISSENTSAAESRIRDTDMAKEMMNFTKGNVLQQASISMLAQANQAPQSVLKLLG